ncbi:MAG: hypothetical protein FIA99_17740, partial [Ruminiclostridium sp.]|nr:hypothetical protein [Ruminiclostridium sp.]
GQMKEAASYIKFPPEGVRAAGPGLGNTDYEPVDEAEWVRKSNSETVLIAHVESRKGLLNIEEILQVPEVDIMFVGMFDLTVSLGYPGKFDHPDVLKAMKCLFETAISFGKVPGMWTPSYEIAEYWIKQGVRYFMTVGDIEYIAQGSRNMMKTYPGHGIKNK